MSSHYSTLQNSVQLHVICRSLHSTYRQVSRLSPLLECPKAQAAFSPSKLSAFFFFLSFKALVMLLQIRLLPRTQNILFFSSLESPQLVLAFFCRALSPRTKTSNSHLWTSPRTREHTPRFSLLPCLTSLFSYCFNALTFWLRFTISVPQHTMSVCRTASF